MEKLDKIKEWCGGGILKKADTFYRYDEDKLKHSFYDACSDKEFREYVDKKEISNKVYEEQIINELMLKRNDIAWLGIDIEGTNVIVKIVKA